RLVVECAPILLPEVGLVAAYFVVVGDAFGAELDAGVGLRPVAEQLEPHLQFEVAVGLGGAQELVTRDGGVERPADDGPVLDAPRLGGVALPPGERLAVEEHFVLGANRARDERRGEEDEREAGHRSTPKRSQICHLICPVASSTTPW